MATYKVLQDIEAEDHILGPLSLRQFIYALVAIFCGYLSFIVIAKHAAFFLVIFLPPMLFFGFLAFPFGRDQPTEVWAIAKLRFLVMPRRRIWDQTGIKELVTITVPKRIERNYTDNLSQTEVKSRLKALANTIDSRGWAIKNVNVNMYRPPTMENPSGSDRLIDMDSVPQAVPDYDVQPSDDILDEATNPVAQQVTQMIGASTQSHRQELIHKLNDIRADQAEQKGPADYWFLNQPVDPPKVPMGNATFNKAQVVAPGADSMPGESAALAGRLQQPDHTMSISNAHLRTIQPLGTSGADDAAKAVTDGAQSTDSPAPDPALQQLAHDDDKNIATLAREAKRAKGEDLGDDEVTISLR